MVKRPAEAGLFPQLPVICAIIEAMQPAEFELSSVESLSYAEFGEGFLRQILHLDRVLESVDRILGEEFHLGPMGAGPGRRLARLTAHGRYGPTYGEAQPGPDVAYLVNVPVDVAFELAIPLDTHRFRADVVVPLRITLRLEHPVTIVWDIEVPSPDEVSLKLTNEALRSAVLQRIAGIDGELRGFLTRFVDRELNKPYVLRARRIPLVDIIDRAWDPIAEQFLPDASTDRS